MPQQLSVDDITASLVDFPTVWATAAVLLLLALASPPWHQTSVSKIPIVGRGFGLAAKKDFWSNAKSLLREGYQKYPVFRIQGTSGPTVMLSRDYMIELLKRPDEVHAEFEEPVKRDMQSKYTGLTTYNPIINHLIRSELTPGIPRFTPRVASELENILRAKLPQTDEWQPIKVIESMLEIVSIGAGTILVGKDLCYRPEWLKCSIGYTLDVMMTANILKILPFFVRPFVAPLLPSTKKIKGHERDIQGLLMPVIRERRSNEGKPGYLKPDDFLQFMMDNNEKFNVTDEHIANSMLGIGLVSMHSTTMTSVQGLYDLAARPEYVEPLRAEIRQALDSCDGDLSKDALYNCKLLDSFLKESQRLSPIILAFGKRVLKNGFHLSDGTYLPPGTITAVPSEAVNADPAVFENPDEFDGYRFYRLRQQPGLAGERNQWISTNKTNLNFGYGKHSCPGRFFAAMEIKLMFAFILLHYDVKIPDEKEGRFKNITFGDAQTPDPEKVLLIRKAKSA